MPDPRWRVELWDDLAAAGGARKAIIPVVEGSMTRAIDNTDSLTAEAWLDNEWLQHAKLRAVLRVVGPSSQPREEYEWRISGVRQGRGLGEDATIGLKAVSPLSDLMFAGLIVEQSTAGQAWYNLGGIGLTPSQYLETFGTPTLELYGSTYNAVGTVDDTDPLDLAWDRWTVRQLVDEMVTRTNAELEYVMAGTSGYTLNLWDERGSTVGTRLLRTGKNLRMLRWRRQLEHLRTVVVPAGQIVPGAVEAAGIDQAAWLVSAISGGTSGGTFTLADVSSGDGPVAFNDQLSTHWTLLPDASLCQISSASTGNVLRTTDDLSALSTGQRVEFRASSGGMRITELANPAQAASSMFGRIVLAYEDEQFRGEHNLVRGGLWSEWPEQTYGYPGTATSSG